MDEYNKNKYGNCKWAIYLIIIGVIKMKLNKIVSIIYYGLLMFVFLVIALWGWLFLNSGV